MGDGGDGGMGGWGDGESTPVGRLPQYEGSGVSVHAERAGLSVSGGDTRRGGQGDK